MKTEVGAMPWLQGVCRAGNAGTSRKWKRQEVGSPLEPPQRTTPSGHLDCNSLRPIFRILTSRAVR